MLYCDHNKEGIKIEKGDRVYVLPNDVVATVLAVDGAYVQIVAPGYDIQWVSKNIVQRLKKA